MSDISSLYKREITLLHKELKEFVDNHEALTEDDIIENPHINRLTQAFSLLHANLHLTLEESFTHFIDNLFNLLYPHYNAPIPSMAIMVLEPDKNNQETIELRKGLLLELSNGDKICNFNLCYDTQIMPAKIIKSSCKISDEKKTKSIITIKLQAISKMNFNELGIKKIRFYIKGINEVKYTIYQNIFNNVLSVSLDSNNKTIILDNNKIKKVGFNEEDSVLPKNKHSFIGYRVLTEFFALTDKFLFFDLDLSSVDLNGFDSNLEIKFYLDNKGLVDLITEDNFVLNASPAINLCEQESDPINIDAESYEHPIMFNKSDELEICSINQVIVNIGDNNEVEAHPLLNFDHETSSEDSLYYITKKKSILHKGIFKKSNTYVSLGNIDFLDGKSDKYFYVNSNCFNGDLPRQIYAEDNTKITLIDNTIPIDSIRCIAKPTAVTKLCKSDDQKWNMIAHFSPHYLNLLDSINGKNIFKEILKMYCCEDTKIHQNIIDSIIDITVSEKIIRVQTKKYNQFCKGNHIEIIFSKFNFSEGVLYLFLNTIEYFLSIYCSINSFIQLSGKMISKDGKKIYEGLPRNGEKCMI